MDDAFVWDELSIADLVGLSLQVTGSFNEILVELVRRYCNRSDLQEQLTATCRMANALDVRDNQDLDLTVPARLIPTWRVRDRLTDDDVLQLFASFLAGTSKRELATQYGISFGAVKDLLRRHGVRRSNQS